MPGLGKTVGNPKLNRNRRNEVSEAANLEGEKRRADPSERQRWETL